MLTQFQTIEPQAAILAACPRPRALAGSAFASASATVVTAAPVFATELTATSGFATAVFDTAVIATAGIATAGIASSVHTTSVPGAEWSRATAPLAAAVRRPGSVDERPQAGYGVRSVPSAAARVETGGNGSTGSTMAGTADQPNLQDKQHLTARRGPVTWRPPH